jgi:hypothetical protein
MFSRGRESTSNFESMSLEIQIRKDTPLDLRLPNGPR